MVQAFRSHAARRARLERERRLRSVEARVRELRDIGARCARVLGEGPPAIAHGDLLYDEHGLPR